MAIGRTRDLERLRGVGGVFFAWGVVEVLCCYALRRGTPFRAWLFQIARVLVERRFALLGSGPTPASMR